MTTINLHQNKQEESAAFSIKNAGGLLFSIGIVVLVLLGIVGLKYYVPKAQAINENLTRDVAAENVKLVGLKDLEQVVDMQARTAEIRKNLEIVNGEVSRPAMTKILDMVGLELNKGVVVTVLKYEADKLTISFETIGFGDVARQIFNFKSSKNFDQVNLTSVARKETAVVATVEMMIKKTDVLATK
ncbi:MAG: hypothetical protein WCI36_00065 [bacterium]